MEADKYKVYGVPVRSYWHDAETGMIKGMEEVLKRACKYEDPEEAKAYITDYCNRMQEQAFSDAGELLNDVTWYMNYNSNTLKNGRNPETKEVLDQLKPIDPLTVDLDSSPYYEIPEISQKDKKESSPIIIIAGGALIILGFLAIFLMKRKGSEH